MRSSLQHTPWQSVAYGIVLRLSLVRRPSFELLAMPQWPRPCARPSALRSEAGDQLVSATVNPHWARARSRILPRALLTSHLSAVATVAQRCAQQPRAASAVSDSPCAAAANGLRRIFCYHPRGTATSRNRAAPPRPADIGTFLAGYSVHVLLLVPNNSGRRRIAAAREAKRGRVCEMRKLRHRCAVPNASCRGHSSLGTPSSRPRCFRWGAHMGTGTERLIHTV